jgi:thiamine biosynthesis lipoprotein
VGQPVALGEDLLFLLARAAEISQLTEGAFDVTSAYGVQHWRRARRKKKLPAEEETLKAVAMTDWRKIAVDKATGIATKHREGQLVDLGGIGKGYAADVALEVLRGRGITQALVAASGDLAIGDPPPGKEGWAVAVRTFEDKGENDRLRQVILSNCGCSTSGDLHQFLELNGTRYSHIVDPRTGLGLTSRVACTVVARDAATSDALATAFCVMGPDGVASLVAAHPGLGLKVRFSLMSDDGVQTKEMNFPPWQ